MLSSSLKRQLRDGHVTIGAWLTMAHISIAEILALAGYDWVVIDTEHTAIGDAEALQLLVATENGGAVPLVRVAGIDTMRIKAAMDSGAGGVIVPGVKTRADAELAVGSVKYPPMGFRGVGLARAHAYGPKFADYVARNNEDSIVILQIEHIDAVRSIDDILSVAHVNGTFIGPYDLSASMGVPGQLDHPQVRAAEERVIAASLDHGAVPGIHLVHVTPGGDSLRRAVERGFRFIAMGTDALILGDGYRQTHDEARAVLSEMPGQ